MTKFLDLPKVSFIVITHNFSNFVCDCLNSIKNQTYKNFEIIVVDDVSKDDTREKIENFINENPFLNITFIKNENNIGQLASFIEGLKVSKGQFVCSIDGDDVLFPEYCAIHIETHLSTSVALTTCQQVEIDENNVIHTLCSIDSPCSNKNEFLVEQKSYDDLSAYKDAKNIDKDSCKVKVLDCDKYTFATWHWSPTTSGMMRKSVCEMLMLIDKAKAIKITADKFMFSFCHLIGSSAIIYKPLYAYRRHGHNYSMANPVMGNKKYLKEKTQNKYFRNNKKIRRQMYLFITEHKALFKEKLNKANLMMIYKRIFFSFDRRFFKGIIKSLFI